MKTPHGAYVVGEVAILTDGGFPGKSECVFNPVQLPPRRALDLVGQLLPL
jgi:hypothetical protein